MHILEINKELVDDLSRNQAYAHLSKVPEASQLLTHIPMAFLGLWLDKKIVIVSHLAGPISSAALSGHRSNNTKGIMTRRHVNLISSYKFTVSSPFPLSEQLLTYYAAFLAEDGLKYQSIKTYIAALHHYRSQWACLTHAIRHPFWVKPSADGNQEEAGRNRKLRQEAPPSDDSAHYSKYQISLKQPSVTSRLCHALDHYDALFFFGFSVRAR